jgi:hypothetical protein
MTYRPWRYAAEVAGALGCAAVFVATLVEPRWFELLFDESPDGGDGSFEAALALGCSLVLGLLCGRLAWRDRQRRLQDRALD